MSLRWRLSLLVAGTVTMVVVMTGLGARVLVERQLMSETDDLLVSRAIATPHLRGTDRSGLDLRAQRPRFAGGEALVDFELVLQWLDDDGDVILVVGEDVAVPVTDLAIDLAVNGGSPQFETVTFEQNKLRVLTRPYPEGGAIMVARDLSENDRVLAGFRGGMVTFGLMGIFVAALVGWQVARRIAEPLERLTKAAEHVATHQDLAPIDIDRDDEVGRLGTSFNAMLLALATSREQQQRLVQDASHEIRTPLTSLRMNVELLQQEQSLSDEDRTEILAALHVEVGELTTLSAELVELASDPTRAGEQETEFDLGDLAASVVERARQRYQRTILIERSGSSLLSGQMSGLERAISNLVDNAVKFSPSDSEIEVRVEGLRLGVRDNGAGITSDDAAKIFDRFYRSEQARSEPGSGLGLSIVDQIVVRHGGETFVQVPDGGGALVGFDLAPS